MEVKKSYSADLERGIFRRFLWGLLFALTLIYVGVEWTFRPSYDIDEDALSDDLAQEIELMPAVEHQDMVAIMETPSQTLSDHIQIVDEATDETPMENPNTHLSVEGDLEGAVKGSELTTAIPQTPLDEDNPLNFRVVEQLPEFPGGMVAFMKWLTHNLKYPQAAQQQKIQGKVVVSFIVNKDGSLTDAKVVQPVNPMLDREAMRVVKMMPKWKPGVNNNQPCRTMIAIPVVFKL